MNEPITIIGANTVVSGNLEGDEDLTIEGRVEGSISLSKTLTVESMGVVHANINVRNAIISGVLVGNVTAEDSVHITEEGRVVGDISAPRVILVDGSSFRGSIDMGDFDIDRGDTASSARAGKSTKLMTARETPRESAPSREESRAEEEKPRPKPASPAPMAARPAPKPAPRPPVSRPVTSVVKPPQATASSPSPNKPDAGAISADRRPMPPAPKIRPVGKVKAIKKK